MTAADATYRLLVVDDSADTREVLQRVLSRQGYDVLAACDVAEALEILRSARVDLVITDLKMPGASGLELIRHVKEDLRDTEVVTITGYPSLESAVAAVKMGAEEYVTKPFTQEELLAIVRRTMERVAARDAARERLEAPGMNPLGIVAASEAMQKVMRAVSRLAAAESPVLITGESGAGKELVARAVHHTGPRAVSPFIVVRCAGMPEDTLERQLFGCAGRGGDSRSETRAGCLELAGGGTVFLHDVSELGRAVQGRLLRALADGEFCPVGSARRLAASFRLIAASHRDLRPLADNGAFREDLYLRLSANTIAVPALRHRDNDLILLAQHFLTRFATDIGRPVPSFSRDALDLIRRYPWPGNVGELQDRIEQVLASGGGGVIEASDLPEALQRWARSPAQPRSLAELEADHIRAVLESVAGNKTRAAEILGINRKTLRGKLKQLSEDAGTG